MEKIKELNVNSATIITNNKKLLKFKTFLWYNHLS